MSFNPTDIKLELRDRCMTHKTVAEILAEKKLPAVAIDQHGLFFFVNKAFEKAYGWQEKDLIGQVVTKIMPPYMRDAHNFGFSRFLTTEESRILSKPLDLPVFCKSGEIVEAQHYILGEKRKGAWRFAATIKPRTKKG